MKLKTVTKNVLTGVLLAAMIFTVLFVLSHFVLKILFLVIFLGVGIIWLLPFIGFKKFLSFFLIGIMLFATSFSIIEFNMLRSTGIRSPDIFSPSTLVTLSLEQTVKNIENSDTFAFLQLEYPGGFSLSSIELNSPVVGRVSVKYYTRHSNTEIVFYASNGGQYTVQISQYPSSNMREDYAHSQMIAALQQIDFWGLEWFYDQSLTIVQNKTGSIPSIDVLSISIADEQHNTYQGFALTLIGYSVQPIETGGLHGHSVFIASFQPNGNLIYVS